MSRWIRKDRVWPAIVIGVLALDVAVGIAMMRVADDDPTYAIEPDYYHKAITWDSTVAQAERNRALGWTLAPTLGARGMGRPAALALQLRDRIGQPIDSAVVRVEAMPVAHANAVVEVTLPGAGQGSYGAPVTIAEPGLWEFRLMARRGEDRFTADFRLEVPDTGAARLVTGRPWEAPPARLEAGVRPDRPSGP
jgi:nitrogen fixation protein FixH